ncbi:class I SAM-dependent methyltransferase [Blastochloris sulfoviridis]|uniref:Class I SAM-dependent methyltransferase n=1 Tax=Blastochloris sulfoviridis TaxID=50712 RepID=A0A5M6HMR3_9HYPH|nr:class I SAM-dependent methyltransferase [Blastochloris sulfoviridis]KAA5597152.1 class I SAM-dependent methyltransferase [Blastochloris sulfoviridis]
MSAPLSADSYGAHFGRSIMTLLARSDAAGAGPVFRVLDVGCGRGRLMADLYRILEASLSGRKVEIHGLEVTEHRAAEEGYTARAVASLTESVPEVDWRQHLHLCSDRDPWPFPNGHFDCIVSNQVLEHVADHALFFAEHARVLTPAGFGIHRFPPRENLWDGHLHLPLVHKARDIETVAGLVRWASRLGLGKFRGAYKAEKLARGFTLEDYVRYQSEYVWYHLNYITTGDALRLAKKNRLKASLVLSATPLQRLIERLTRRAVTAATPYDLALLDRFLPVLGLLHLRANATLTVEKSRLKRYGVWTDQ